jgi:hypothetical protein
MLMLQQCIAWLAWREEREGGREREREREREERERRPIDPSPCERHFKEVERDRDKGSFSTFTRTNFFESRFIPDYR